MLPCPLNTPWDNKETHFKPAQNNDCECCVSRRTMMPSGKSVCEQQTRGLILSQVKPITQLIFTAYLLDFKH